MKKKSILPLGLASDPWLSTGDSFSKAYVRDAITEVKKYSHEVDDWIGLNAEFAPPLNIVEGDNDGILDGVGNTGTIGNRKAITGFDVSGPGTSIWSQLKFVNLVRFFF